MVAHKVKSNIVKNKKKAKANKKLTPRQQYAIKLKDHRWQEKRLKILLRDDYTCQKCCKKTKRILHVHHTVYQGEPWECPDKYLITLCASHHKEVHASGVKIETIRPKKKIIALPVVKKKNVVPSRYLEARKYIEKMRLSKEIHLNVFAFIINNYPNGKQFDETLRAPKNYNRMRFTRNQISPAISFLVEDRCIDYVPSKNLYKLNDLFIVKGKSTIDASTNIIEYAEQNLYKKQIPHK